MPSFFLQFKDKDFYFADSEDGNRAKTRVEKAPHLCEISCQGLLKLSSEQRNNNSLPAKSVNIIEILHIIGAKDAYIAQQYAKRMGFLGFIGGLIGLFLAIPSIFFIGNLATAIEGGIISDATLSIIDWGIILSLPLFSMIISMITAYYTVKRTLKKML